LKEPLSASLKLVAITTVALIFWAGYGIYSFDQPVKAYEITSGHAGPFMIGEGKESILARLPDEFYSPHPQPVECPANWISVKDMSPIQRQCLMNASQWETEVQELCPEKTDSRATLFFTGNKLVKVAVRCTRPE
jgi:hypothetical protein